MVQVGKGRDDGSEVEIPWNFPFHPGKRPPHSSCYIHLGFKVWGLGLWEQYVHIHLQFKVWGLGLREEYAQICFWGCWGDLITGGREHQAGERGLKFKGPRPSNLNA